MPKTKRICYLQHIHRGVELIFSDHSTISYPLHNHVSVFTAGMVLEGAVWLRTGNHARVCEKGQTFAVCPYVPHSLKADAPYTLVSLCIHKDLFNSDHWDQEKGIAERLNRCLDACGFGKINQRQIAQLLGVLRASKDSGAQAAKRSETAFIEALKQRLEQSPERRLSVEEMARDTFTSKYHLIRRFKQAVGLTPHQFQLQNRIRKAQRLIPEAATITEVALTTGFCDQSHFIRQFEKYVGLTPTAYKKSCGRLSFDANR